ncbi:MAG: hypothetical protein K2J68_06760 [Treponemataceae bacterium]|nr:hypothetical protein [Treponemataceae bacterium]
MNNIETIKKIFALYYERDDETKREKEDYLEHKDECDFLCEKHLKMIRMFLEGLKFVRKGYIVITAKY